jgi:hypothetical protein
MLTPDAVKHEALVNLLQAAEPLLTLFIVLAALLSISSLVVRFRRTRRVERQQLKWFTYVGGLIIVAFVVAGVTATLDPVNKGAGSARSAGSGHCSVWVLGSL